MTSKALVLVGFVTVTLLAACGGRVAQQGQTSATGSSSTGSGGAGGAGGGNPCWPDSCTGPSATVGAGGSAQQHLNGLVAQASLLPSSNVPQNAQPSDSVLELFFAPNNYACGDVGSATIQCDNLAIVFALPADLKPGTYSIPGSPWFIFTWGGTCSDGGGGPMSNATSGVVTITKVEQGVVEGSISGIEFIDQHVFDGASFSAADCRGKL